MSRGRPRAALVAVAAAVAVAVAGATVVVGCGSGGGAANDEITVPRVSDLTVDPAAVLSDIDSDRADVATAESIRGRLEQDLLWHGISIVQVMRSAAQDDPEAAAWTDQLNQNTLDLTATIGLVFGPDAARGFNQQWSQHAQLLVDYAAAIGDNDQAAAGEALASLRQYARDAGSFFATVSEERLRAAKITELLDTHVDHMTQMINALVNGSAVDAIDRAIADGGHLAAIGHVVAMAIAHQQPIAFPGSTETPAAAAATVITTQAAAFLVSVVMAGEPTDAMVVAASDALAATVGMSTVSYLGLDVVPIEGGPPRVAAAARLALDRAATESAPPPAPVG